MPLISVTVAHHQTLDEARRRLEKAVQEVSERVGGLARVEWSADRSRVKLTGIAGWVEMWLDDRDVHATADIPILGGLLSGPLASNLKQIVQQTFRKELP
jgi:hypothetical protein